MLRSRRVKDPLRGKFSAFMSIVDTTTVEAFELPETVIEIMRAQPLNNLSAQSAPGDASCLRNPSEE